MSNFQTYTNLTGGLPGTAPSVWSAVTTDGLGTITATGYLNDLDDMLKANDILFINYSDTSTQPPGLVATLGQFYVSVSGANASLIAFPSGLGTAAGKNVSDNTKATVASVSGATQINHILVAADIAGTVKDGLAVTSIASGNLQAGLSGTAGTVASFPGTAANGSLILAAVNAGGAFNTTISNRVMGQSTVFSIGDPGAATASILTSLVNADVGANLISFDVTVPVASLATGGSVTLQASSGSKQYKIRMLELESGGTNFSGGGGDRLGQVTDGTTVYTVIPAANMQSLVNARWGVSTVLPNAASAANNTSTAAGAAVVFKYSGGGTDYTAGSLRISGLMERVA